MTCDACPAPISADDHDAFVDWPQTTRSRSRVLCERCREHDEVRRLDEMEDVA